jgi:hypothetical protein
MYLHFFNDIIAYINTLYWTYGVQKISGLQILLTFRYFKDSMADLQIHLLKLLIKTNFVIILSSSLP